VLSTIIARICGQRPDMPLVVSYDESERVNSRPMPLPFQWLCQMANRTISERSLCQNLNQALAAIGIIDASGRPLRHTFHDFRRLFITDAIMHGMPPHIASSWPGTVTSTRPWV
jgi:hypothetical protein